MSSSLQIRHLLENPSRTVVVTTSPRPDTDSVTLIEYNNVDNPLTPDDFMSV